MATLGRATFLVSVDASAAVEAFRRFGAAVQRLDTYPPTPEEVAVLLQEVGRACRLVKKSGTWQRRRKQSRYRRAGGVKRRKGA